MAPWIYPFDDAPVHQAQPRSQVVFLTHSTPPCRIAGFELTPINATNQYDPIASPCAMRSRWKQRGIA